MMVSGTPTRQYSRNPISTRASRAASTTMRLATEPRIVRFPASVEAMARMSHARAGSPKLGITGLNSNTAGTFETTFESTAVTVVSMAGRQSPIADAQGHEVPDEPGLLDPPGENEKADEEHQELPVNLP